jgi:hypothetical protein
MCKIFTCITSIWNMCKIPKIITHVIHVWHNWPDSICLFFQFQTVLYSIWDENHSIVTRQQNQISCHSELRLLNALKHKSALWCWQIMNSGDSWYINLTTTKKLDNCSNKILSMKYFFCFCVFKTALRNSLAH